MARDKKERNDSEPNFLSELVRRSSILVYELSGWTAVQEAPPPRKCVIIAAPHTSNWDFLYFFGLSNSLNIKSHWIGKHSLFRWPFGNILRRMGGFPVDRSKSQNLVDTMIQEFNSRDDFILTIPPEGTRSNVRQWRTGFYHIAMGANVPLICGLMDYAKKVGGLGPAFMPTGDYDADMKIVGEYYHSVTPKFPEKRMSNIIHNAPDK